MGVELQRHIESKDKVVQSAEARGDAARSLGAYNALTEGWQESRGDLASATAGIHRDRLMGDASSSKASSDSSDDAGSFSSGSSSSSGSESRAPARSARGKAKPGKNRTL